MENDRFTSQLLVMVYRDLNNKTVNCLHDSASGVIVVGTSTVHIMEG